MVSKIENIEPQLEFVEHDDWVAVALTNKEKLSLYNKSQKSGISTDILEEVYHRGYHAYFAELAIDSEMLTRSPEQYAFERVNSFISGGMASQIDEDLKKACWKGYEAVGMKKKNGKTVPNCVPVKEEDINEISPELVGKVNKARAVGNKPSKTIAAGKTLQTAVKKAFLKSKVGIPKEEYTGTEKVSNSSDDPSSRFVGTTSLTNVYKKMTPGYETIKKTIREKLKGEE